MKKKFSVLLPTRNGGSFLGACMQSILSQEYDGFEVIISDNANVDETPEIIRKFATDKRVIALRSDHVISVTENWKKTLEAASGEYVLMMGDDDYLLPGYLRLMDKVLSRYADPDCVLYNGFSYVAPNSINGNAASYYRTTHFPYKKDLSREGIISAAHRLAIVRDMFRFRIRIPLNMQTTLVSRRAIERIDGPIFKAPFPDHYALNALLLTAATWVFVPEKPVVIGISPKSFGHYVYSNAQANGLAYLGISRELAGMLPGSPLVNGMYAWLTILKNDFPEVLRDVDIDRASYVRHQFLAWCRQMRAGVVTWREFAARLRYLSGRDHLGLLQSFFDSASWERALRPLLSIDGAKRDALLPLAKISNIDEFARWLHTSASTSHK